MKEDPIRYEPLREALVKVLKKSSCCSPYRGNPMDGQRRKERKTTRAIYLRGRGEFLGRFSDPCRPLVRGEVCRYTLFTDRRMGDSERGRNVRIDGMIRVGRQLETGWHMAIRLKLQEVIQNKCAW